MSGEREQPRNIIQSLSYCFTGAPELSPSPPPLFVENEKEKIPAMTQQQRSLAAPKLSATTTTTGAAGALPMTPATGSSAEAAAIVALEHALTKSGSAVAIKTAAKELLSSGVVFSSPLGRVVGRDAVARYFRLWQVLFVDDCTFDAVAIGELMPAGGGGGGSAGGLFGPPPLHAEGRGSSFEQQQQQQQPRRAALARLTHRLHPRFLDALAAPAHGAALLSSSWDSAGRGGGEGVATFELLRGQTIERRGAPIPPHAHSVSSASAPSPSSPLPAPLAYFFSWLRARLTFTLVDNAVYVFESESVIPAGGLGGGGAGGTSGAGGGGVGGGQMIGGGPPKISSIRAEIALVSLIYALPFGALMWHGAVEPAVGAAAQVADALWGTWVRPWALPWARQALGYGGLDML